jgi:ATP:corrinoid adenosyltransferase
VAGRPVTLPTAAPPSGPDTSGWTVLHSFDIADHRRQLAGEIDFLCVVPGKGVLVVEVKGCHELARHDGDWYYGRSAEPDHRGPFRQASDAMHSLRQRLVKLHPELGGIPFWSAACFPFIDFSESSPEWHSWQVVDRRALQAQPIARLIEGVLVQARKHLVEHHAGWFHPEKGEPTPHQCDALVDLLRPDFEFFESPKSRLQRLNEEVRHYTDEQFEALDTIDANPRIVFDGPAGTGKTLLAIEAARRAAARGRRVLLLCFNRPLGRWLQDETAGMGRGVTARTLHEHLRLLAGIAPTREQRCRTEFWQDELPAMALEALLEREGDGGQYDEIVLDEAQDVLRRSYLDALDLSLRGGLEGGHWRFFGDFTWQRIYDAAALSVDEFLDPPAGARAAGAAPVSAMRCELRINCRNTPRVAGLACAAGHVSPGYRRVRRPDDDVEPELRWYEEAGEQLELLRSVLTELRDEGFSGSRVAVLSPFGNERCAAAQLTEQPWRDRLAPLVREPGEEEEDVGDWLKACIPSDLDAVDLRSGAIKYASIYRFKGLESPAVVITDVEALENPVQRSLIYVACTRALHRLVILARREVRAQLTV